MKLRIRTIAAVVFATPLAAQVGVLAVHPSQPVKSVQELIALEPMFMTPEQYALRLKSDYDKYAKLIALIGAKVD